MDTTEAWDTAALLRVPDIYRQTERGIIYSERERGGEYIHWSGWLIREGGGREEKTTAVDWTGLFWSLALAEVWQALHFSHLILRAAASWIHRANLCLTSKHNSQDMISNQRGKKML